MHYESLRDFIDNGIKSIVSIDQKKNTGETLIKLMENISKSPSEDKFRRLNSQNARLQVSIFQFPGIVELLCFLGFTNNSAIYVMDTPGA